MPENSNKKKESKKHQEQEVSIKVEGREEQAVINQGKLNVKEPNGKEEGKSSGGLVKGIVNLIKGIANAIFDMSQQEQSGSREKSSDRQKSEMQGQWISLVVNQTIEQKNPKDLDQKKIKEAAEGLKEEVQRNDGRNEPIGESITPDKLPNNEEEVTSGGRGV